MKLVALRVENFRGYKDPTSIHFSDLTALVGRNDVGKSTIFDALGVFFKISSCKLDISDLCVHADKSSPIRITCIFDDLPTQLILDDAAETSLKDEGLLNASGFLEITKVYSGSGLKEEVFAVCNLSDLERSVDLLSLKNTELKRVAKERGVHCADDRSNVLLRRAIRASLGASTPSDAPIALAKEGAKQVWSALQAHLPLYALFRSDRPSTDEDGEVQDPMRLAIKEAILEVGEELQRIQAKVEARALEVATRTLKMVGDLSPDLASTLQPQFRADQKWENMFKLSLLGDDGIAINKRGSGVRRLIILAFFQAEVERRRTQSNVKNVIYAIEEPETSQHPSNQTAVIESLKALSETPGAQVLVTTHVPALAGLVPAGSIHHITKRPEVHRAIEQGDGILKAIASDLGVVPSYQDSRVQVFLCLEGPTDIEFFQRVTPAIRTADPSVIELGVDPRVALIPLGGTTLQDWVNKRYLRELNMREVHIYDSDVTKYAKAVDDVNLRRDGSWAVMTVRREIENYLDAAAIKTVVGADIVVAADTDIEKEIITVTGQKRFGRKSIKRALAEDAVPLMTRERLQKHGVLDEVLGWYRRISDMLT